jgi:hypothetical protein
VQNNNNKNGPMKKCLPNFVKNLNNRILKRKRDIIEKFQENARGIKFSNLFKKYVDKNILKPTKEAVNLIHRNAL